MSEREDGGEGQLTDEQFRVLMDLMMVSDPWPLDDGDGALQELLHSEARLRGFGGWYTAFHEFEVGLYEKYTVLENGKPVEECFVLEPDDDHAARDAILAYAHSTDNDALAEDLIDWMSEYPHTEHDQ